METSEELIGCHYCGLLCDSWDHVPPVSIRSSLRELGIPFQIKDVPACRECNSAIGANGPLSLTERMNVAKEHLRRKYSSYLSIPEWTDSELSQLSLNMQRYIASSCSIKELIQARLRWPRINSKERFILRSDTEHKLAKVPQKSFTRTRERMMRGNELRDIRNLQKKEYPEKYKIQEAEKRKQRRERVQNEKEKLKQLVSKCPRCGKEKNGKKALRYGGFCSMACRRKHRYYDPERPVRD